MISAEHTKITSCYNFTNKIQSEFENGIILSIIGTNGTVHSLLYQATGFVFSGPLEVVPSIDSGNYARYGNNRIVTFRPTAGTDGEYMHLYEIDQFRHDSPKTVDTQEGDVFIATDFTYY